MVKHRSGVCGIRENIIPISYHTLKVYFIFIFHVEIDGDRVLFGICFEGSSLFDPSRTI